MKEFEYAKDMWGVGNAITAFAVLQAIAFYALVGRHKSEMFCAITHQRTLTYVGVLAGTLGQAWIIAWRNRTRSALRLCSSSGKPTPCPTLLRGLNNQ